MQRSLRVRLLIGGAFAVFVALAVAWAAMSVLFERHLQRQVAADLTARGLEVVGTLGPDLDDRGVVGGHLRRAGERALLASIWRRRAATLALLVGRHARHARSATRG